VIKVARECRLRGISFVVMKGFLRGECEGKVVAGGF
jgi:hypothetical protein